MSVIDLHMHSLWSDDGEFTVQELVDMCLSKKLTYFSISDHNRAKAGAEAIEYIKDKNIRFIPGIELDCDYQGTNLHILGYGIDHAAPVYEEIHSAIHQQGLEASKKRLAAVRKLGLVIDEETIWKLSANGVIGGEMLAEAALMNSENDNSDILKPYRPGGARSDNPLVNFHWDYCAQGKPAYAHIDFISLDEAVATIHKTGGVAVLAHPGNNTKENIAMLDGIIAGGIDGIEVYSSYHNTKQIDFYRDLAAANRLLITCGSDFHGKIKPAIFIGDIQVKENESELIERLLEKIEFYQREK